VSIKLCAKMLLSGILLSCFASCPAFCRSWKPAPDAMARDYATITDARGKGEMVLLMWFAPQMVSPSAPGAPALTAMLEKYIVLVATHAHVNPTTAAMTFVPVDQLEAHDGAGSALAPVPRETLPPATTGVLALSKRCFANRSGPWAKA